MKKYEAILIPGCGVREEGRLPEWVQRRIDLAAKLFTGKEYLIALSAGTTHKPPVLDKNGFPIYESIAITKALIKSGIPPDRILTETFSLDTIGNAYFARMIHTEPREFKKLCIISSEFQMLRIKEIFNFLFNLNPLKFKYKLSFKEVSDAGIETSILKPRIKREQEALKNFKKQMKEEQITDLNKFHNWLYTKHKAYASNFLGQKDEITKEEKRSY